MRRLIVERDEVAGDRLELSSGRAKRLGRVLRLGPGDCFVAVLADGSQRVATIESVGQSGLRAALGEAYEAAPVPAAQVTLFPALLKGDAMALTIQKTVELGVAAIRPVITERCVPRVAAQDRARKAQRWNQIARQAAEQCERGAAPAVSAPVELAEAVATHGAACALICAERGASGAAAPIARALKEMEEVASVAVFVGPEGGYTEAEMRLACAAGLLPVWLGPRILRAETAAIVACAIVLYHSGQME